jgi:hypothetical protein
MPAASSKKVKTVVDTTNATPAPKAAKKTRSSKIVTKQQISSAVTTPPIANVILNLKCSVGDLKEYNDKLSRMISNPLEYNSSAPPEVKYYDGEKNFGSLIRERDHNDTPNVDETHSHETQQTLELRDEFNDNVAIIEHEPSKMVHTKDETEDVNVKDMSAKIKQLKIQLYKNTLNSEKKSACFWCTYDFDNAPCYIPKYEMDGTIYGYGSFCRPECAVAYLMKETIDDSTKFDRYHLLNQIYSKVYDCKKNIKPAPDPHYLLDKFYGNLTIQEYRRLLKTEHLLLVIDKPLTRILPELHEDTDDAFTKIYGIKAQTGNTSGVYKVKRQSEQPNGPSKASIIKTTFGITN